MGFFVGEAAGGKQADLLRGPIGLGDVVHVERPIVFRVDGADGAVRRHTAGRSGGEAGGEAEARVRGLRRGSGSSRRRAPGVFRSNQDIGGALRKLDRGDG